MSSGFAVLNITSTYILTLSWVNVQNSTVLDLPRIRRQPLGKKYKFLG